MHYTQLHGECRCVDNSYFYHQFVIKNTAKQAPASIWLQQRNDLDTDHPKIYNENSNSRISKQYHHLHFLSNHHIVRSDKF